MQHVASGGTDWLSENGHKFVRRYAQASVPGCIRSATGPAPKATFSKAATPPFEEARYFDRAAQAGWWQSCHTTTSRCGVLDTPRSGLVAHLRLHTSGFKAGVNHERHRNSSVVCNRVMAPPPAKRHWHGNDPSTPRNTRHDGGLHRHAVERQNTPMGRIDGTFSVDG